MRTFFIVFLPGIALFALCASLGIAILIATIRWSRCFVVRRHNTATTQRTMNDQLEALTAFRDQVQLVLDAVLINDWQRIASGQYRIVLPAETAEALIALHKLTETPHS